jgi:hypothetical protein
MPDQLPNPDWMPGGRLAKIAEIACTCSRLDNNEGKGILEKNELTGMFDLSYIIADGCPLHDERMQQ